jgi:hypothetical protein
MPVIEIKNVPGQTDLLLKSMCAGIDGWLKRQKSGINGCGPIYSDYSKGEDILTYDGPAKTNPRVAERRSMVCKDDTCARQGLECDEYPPAMTAEGGGFATEVCVPAWQNSKTQGPILGIFARRCNLKAGDKFLLRLEGGCDRFRFPARRDVEPTFNMLARRSSNESISGSNGTLADPNGDGSLTYVATHLGQLKAGNYEFDLDLSGATVVQVEVVNQYGDSYALIDNPSSSAHLSFDIADNMSLPAALVAYTEQSFTLTYSGSVKLSAADSRSRMLQRYEILIFVQIAVLISLLF